MINKFTSYQLLHKLCRKVLDQHKNGVDNENGRGAVERGGALSLSMVLFSHVTSIFFLANYKKWGSFNLIKDCMRVKVKYKIKPMRQWGFFIHVKIRWSINGVLHIILIFHVMRRPQGTMKTTQRTTRIAP